MSNMCSRRPLANSLRSAVVKRAIAGILGVLMATSLSTVYAGADELIAEQVSVRQLMQWDTVQALKRARSVDTRMSLRRSQPTTDADTAIAYGQSNPRLVAIYGVGPKLMAEVEVGEDTLLFMRGRAKAVGSGKSHAMRLVGITGQCVRVHWQEREESLCAPTTIPSRG